jgi:hypothetical protein
MKKTLMLATMILAGAAFAQDKAPAAGGPGGGEFKGPMAANNPQMREMQMGRMAEYLCKDCDTNKDGKFDAAEAKAAKEALIKKYDANADGTIDDAEFAKIREAATAAGWVQRMPGKRGGGAGAPGAAKQPKKQ